ncbi:MAG TPA: hypothetical protein VJW17_16690 [Pyrinomonadaceae bacterium]|nr:hypothetical protein [Pyrinomonadaceae bacterium]
MKHALLIILVFASVGVATGQSTQSVYTSLDKKQCRVLKSSGPGDYSVRCRGIGGYSLIVSEGDLRQNIIVITPKGAENSLELWSVVSSGFSSVGPKVEWRTTSQNGKAVPVGLIIRYNVSEDPDYPNKLVSYLAVIKITPNEICVVEKISPGPNANEAARRSADTAGTKPCLKK